LSKLIKRINTNKGNMEKNILNVHSVDLNMKKKFGLKSAKNGVINIGVAMLK